MLPRSVRATAATTAPSACTHWRALTVPDDLAAAVKANAGAGPVLLVDDQIDTGWTMTVAAMLLRKAGASSVLPLALAVTTG
jgi:ATP-dependent DNA helicase RecQ